MTEEEWLACGDPVAMLDFLGGKASGRKVRLFACACCRRVWHHWEGYPGERRAVEVAERLADGAATEEELVSAGYGAEPVPAGGAGLGGAGHNVTRTDAWDAAVAVSVIAAEEVGGGAAHAAEMAGADADAAREAAYAAERGEQPTILRDIFGNPFHPPSPLPAAVLKWEKGTLVRLAQAAYEQRAEPRGLKDATRLSVLADALEDAGWEDTEPVSHLRSPGPHVRGCWAVDLVGGRS